MSVTSLLLSPALPSSLELSVTNMSLKYEPYITERAIGMGIAPMSGGAVPEDAPLNPKPQTLNPTP